MGLKKKKNIIILTLCMVVCFILYQLYFFSTISTEANNSNRVIPILDHRKVERITYLRSEADKFINEEGSIHGVLSAHMQRYRPNSENEFTCLKIEQRIPFHQVNDDYCDCEDGTDEPSTNACVNGTFYCNTQHHKPVSFNSVPSSRVNDGICDCCDGSDEWLIDPKKKLVSQSNKMYYTYYVTKCLNVCN